MCRTSPGPLKSLELSTHTVHKLNTRMDIPTSSWACSTNSWAAGTEHIHSSQAEYTDGHTHQQLGMHHQQLGSSCTAHRRRPSSHPCLLAAGHTPPAAWPSRQASGQPGACATRLELPWPGHLASAASAELQAHGVGSGMDGREGGSRGTDTPAETCL